MSLQGENTITSLFERLTEDETIRVRVIVELNELATPVILPEIEGSPIASYPVASEPNSEIGTSVIQLGTRFFSDAAWYSSPFDSLRPNMYAQPRLAEISNIVRSIPETPEVGRRTQFQIGGFKLSNADRALDELLYEKTTLGQQCNIYIGPANYYQPFIEYRLIAQSKIAGELADRETIEFRFENTTDELDIPLSTRKYTGRGLNDGPASFFGRRKPRVLGKVFNIEPLGLGENDQSNLDQMYQVNDGRIFSFDEIRVGGIALVPEGTDYDTLTELRAAQIGPTAEEKAQDLEDLENEIIDELPTYPDYATCLAQGAFRLNFEPTLDVRCDVRGHVFPSGFSANLGKVLRELLREKNIPSNTIDGASFGAIEETFGDIGYYYDGASDLSVKELFEELLTAINGWFGRNRELGIAVGRLRLPEEASNAVEIKESDIIDIELEDNQISPIYQQTITYKKNWAPSQESDLSVLLSQAEINEYQREASNVTYSDGRIRFINPQAVVGTSLSSYFYNPTDAVKALDSIFELYRRRIKRFSIKLKRKGLKIDINDIVQLPPVGFGIKQNDKAVVVSVDEKFSSASVEVEIKCLLFQVDPPAFTAEIVPRAVISAKDLGTKLRLYLPIKQTNLDYNGSFDVTYYLIDENNGTITKRMDVVELEEGLGVLPVEVADTRDEDGDQAVTIILQSFSDTDVSIGTNKQEKYVLDNLDIVTDPPEYEDSEYWVEGESLL